MIVDYFKYDLYRKYQTSDGVTYTPLDEYQAVMTDFTINDDCGLVPYANLFYDNITGTPRPVRYTVINKQECLSAVIEGSSATTINSTGILTRTSIEGDCNLVGIQNKDITDYNSAFKSCPKLYRIEANKWDTSNVTDMNSMFYGCSLYDGVDINEWNTSNVTNMGSMFYNSSLRTIDLSKWDTSNVTDMSNMFYSCGNLNNLDLSNFNTSKVTDMNNMFYECTSLSVMQNIDSWDTSNVTNMSKIFSNCESLTNVPFTNWNTSKVTDISYMFFGCSSLTSVTLNNFDFSNVTNVGSMLGNCASLKLVNLSGCDFGNAPLSDMFYYASGINSKLESFNISNIKVNGSLPSLHSISNKLIEADLSNINAIGVKNFSKYFSSSYSLKNINFDNFISNDATNMNSMFINCYSLVSVDLSGFNTSNVTNFSSMFMNCTSLEELNLSNFDTSSVNVDYNFGSNVRYMFSGCSKLKKIICKKAFYDWCIKNKGTLSLNSTMVSGTTGILGSGANWEITDFYYLFDNEYTCGSEIGNKYYYVASYEKWKEYDFINDKYTDNVEYRNPKFSEDCVANLNTVLITNNFHYNTTNVVSKQEYFTEYYDYKKDEMNKISGTGDIFLSYSGPFLFVLKDDNTTLNSVFNDCNNLKEIDLSNTSTENITDMGYMFKSCTGLTTLNLSTFNTSLVTNVEYMFASCVNLKSLDLSNFDMSNVTKLESMFYNCKALSSIKCKQSFKDWCISNQDTINLPDSMKEGGSGTWEIV